MCCSALGAAQEYWKGNKLFFMHLPIAFETEEGIKPNPNFFPTIAKKFPNKISRILFMDQEGGARAKLAADKCAEAGWTSVMVVEGGADEYFKFYPLTEKDFRPRVKRVEQFVGIKYGGTGVTNDDTPDDNA